MKGLGEADTLNRACKFSPDSVSSGLFQGFSSSEGVILGHYNALP